MVRKTVVLDGYDKHFVLFANGYYGHLGNLEDRLRIIIEYVSGIAKEKVTTGDVYELMTETFVKLCIAEQPERTKRFLHNIFSHSRDMTVTRFDVIREILREFSVLRVSYETETGVILEIGRPDLKLRRKLNH